MKKVNKVLTSLAAGAMAVSPATSIIRAAEASPNSSSKVEVSQKEEKKDVVLEALKENVDSKKAEAEEAQAKLDKVTPVMQE